MRLTTVIVLSFICSHAWAAEEVDVKKKKGGKGKKGGGKNKPTFPGPAITLMDLPYAYDALAPHISEDTVTTQHTKHHKYYFDKAKAMIAGTWYELADLVWLVQYAYKEKNMALFNNIAQVFNYNCYWKSMKIPDGNYTPTGMIAKMIDETYGSVTAFREAWTSAGLSVFGSGYTWLVYDAKKKSIDIMTTSNAYNPLIMDDITPLANMDVWEHAYYLDHKNMRSMYIMHFIEHLIDWDFVNANLAKIDMSGKKKGKKEEMVEEDED